MTAGLVRALILLALASAVGGLVVERILPEELAAARARLRLMITTSLAVLLLATLAEIIVRTQDEHRHSGRKHHRRAERHDANAYR